MKNYLSISEFKKISEKRLVESKLFKNYHVDDFKLFEAMDEFSNRIGWSDSLVGRMVNKISSFFGKQRGLLQLKQLKVKLDNEYLKGILRAMTTVPATNADSSASGATTGVTASSSIQYPAGQTSNIGMSIGLKLLKTAKTATAPTTLPATTASGATTTATSTQLPQYISVPQTDVDKFSIDILAALQNFAKTLDDAKKLLASYVYDIVPDDNGATINPQPNKTPIKDKQKFTITASNKKTKLVFFIIIDSLENIENEIDINFRVEVVNKKNENEKIGASTGIIDANNKTIGIKIPDGKKVEEYSVDVIPDANITVSPEGRQDAQKTMKYKFTAGKNEEEWTVNISESYAALSQSTTETGLDTVKKTDIQLFKYNDNSSISDNIKEQIKFIKQILDKIDAKECTKDDHGALIQLMNKITKEIENITNYKNNSKDEEEKKEIDECINLLNGLVNDIKTKTDSIVDKGEMKEEEFNKIVLNAKSVSTDNKVLSNFDFNLKFEAAEEKNHSGDIVAQAKSRTQEYRDFATNLTTDIKKLVSKLIEKDPSKEESLKNGVKIIMSSLNNMDQNEKDNMRLIKNLLNKYFPDLSSKYVNESVLSLEKMYEDFITFTEALNEDFTSKTVGKSAYSKPAKSVEKVKDIFRTKNQKLNAEYTNTLKTFGEVDLNTIDPDKVLKAFQSNPALKEKAAIMVNKEALKEIALKAQWLYDEEKYKDKRKDVYSRINWTVTGPDMNKLKNTWYQLVVKSKSTWNPFFTDEKGNFPQTLDPIALINSDESFRKSWNQYDDKARTKNTNTTGSGGNVNAAVSQTQLQQLGLSPCTNPTKANEWYLFDITLADDLGDTSDLALLIMHYGDISTKKKTGFIVHKMVDWTQIIKDSMSNTSLKANDIESLVDKNTISQTNLGNFSEEYLAFFCGIDKIPTMGGLPGSGGGAGFNTKTDQAVRVLVYGSAGISAPKNNINTDKYLTIIQKDGINNNASTDVKCFASKMDTVSASNTINYVLNPRCSGEPERKKFDFNTIEINYIYKIERIYEDKWIDDDNILQTNKGKLCKNADVNSSVEQLFK